MKRAPSLASAKELGARAIAGVIPKTHDWDGSPVVPLRIDGMLVDPRDVMAAAEPDDEEIIVEQDVVTLDADGRRLMRNRRKAGRPALTATGVPTLQPRK